MKRLKQLAAIAAIGFCLGWAIGCGVKANPTTPAQLAPGYSNSGDQKLGQDLSALNGFKDSEVSNYNCDANAQAAKTCLSDAQKAVEKPYLNTLIDAVNVANAAYQAYHQGTQTLPQAQAAFNSAAAAQTTLTANKGVK